MLSGHIWNSFVQSETEQCFAISTGTNESRWDVLDEWSVSISHANAPLRKDGKQWDKDGLIIGSQNGIGAIHNMKNLMLNTDKLSILPDKEQRD